MDVTAVFGIVLGLAGAYWLVATACSFFLEACLSLANIRGKALTQFVAEMLGAEIKRKSTTTWAAWWSELFRKKHRRDRLHAVLQKPRSASGQIVTRVLTHPLIVALDMPSIARRGASVDASYIPSEQFARALLDVIVNTPLASQVPRLIASASIPLDLKSVLIAAAQDTDSDIEFLERLQEAAKQWLMANVSQLQALNDLGLDVNSAIKNNAITPERASALASQFLGLVFNRAERMTFTDLKRALTNEVLPRSLRDSLEPLVGNVAHDVEEARKTVERWFDHTMERATGWYKRYTMIWLFGIGFIVAAVFGIDSIRIGERLINNAEQRAAAERFARRINEDQDEVRAWLQRSLTWLALPADAYLARESTKPFPKQSMALERFKIRNELRLLSAGLVKPEFAGAAVVVVGESVGKRPSLENWERISQLIDEARDCGKEASIPMSARSAGCKPLSVQYKIAQLGQPENAPAASTEAVAFNMPGSQKRSAKAQPKAPAPLSPFKDLASHSESIMKGCQVDAAKTDEPLTESLGRKLACMFLHDPALILSDNRIVASRLGDFLVNENEDSFNDLRAAMNDSQRPMPSFLQMEFNFLSMGCKNASRVDCFLATSEKMFVQGLFGKLLTALMIALGAPFWFELIGKVVNMRGTGGKPA